MGCSCNLMTFHGKILTGNQPDFPMKIMEFSCIFSRKKQSIEITLWKFYDSVDNWITLRNITPYNYHQVYFYDNMDNITLISHHILIIKSISMIIWITSRDITRYNSHQILFLCIFMIILITSHDIVTM